MTVRLYKNGDSMAIETDCKNEDDFISQFNELIDVMIENGDFLGNEEAACDWKFQLDYWIPCLVDICCAYRGYKNNVVKRTVYLSGCLDSSSPDYEIDDRGNIT